MRKQVGSLFWFFQGIDNKILNLAIDYVDGDKERMKKDQNEVVIGNRCWDIATLSH